MDHVKRIILLSLGFLFVTLGIIGMFLPIMPTVPFFIIASVCFSKSSEKFHKLLLENKWVGAQIKDYHENNGIKSRTKWFLLICQWTGVIFTSIFFVHNLFGRILMFMIAVGATTYILSLKTAKE